MARQGSEILQVVVMAKPAVVGRVKTRLIGRLTGEQAAAVHVAMARCVLGRLDEWLTSRQPRMDMRGSGRAYAGVLALDGLLDAPAMEPLTPPAGWRTVDQGRGDLGQRLLHVWESVGGGPCVFFGVDSPDVPARHLQAIVDGLGDADAVCGPVDDGGYWTIGARAAQPRLLVGIDWGGPKVYHQTVQQAAEAGVRLQALPGWHDVDTFDDLAALRRRLEQASDPHLQRLRDTLDTISGSLDHG